MVPIVLDTTKVKTAIAGEGSKALGRLRLLKSHGAMPRAVFAPQPSADLRAEAGAILVARWPGAVDLAEIDVLFAADLDPVQVHDLARAARASKTLLNTEDLPALSDVQVPASLRRGDLLLTASTGGRAPGLAKRLARWLAQAFGPEWDGRLDEIAALRRRLKTEGLSGPALAARTDRFVDEKGWLP